MYPRKTPQKNLLKNLQIFSFKNYRAFLRDAVAVRRSGNSKFSLAYYSRRIKVSDAYLKLVVQGRRNLDLDRSFRLSNTLGFSPAERAYFVTLVLENQATDVGLKRFFRSQLQTLARNKLSYAEDSHLGAVFEDSLMWEVFSLIGIENFKTDPLWIAKKLTNKEANGAAVSLVLEKLLQMGAIEKSSSGSYLAKDIVIPRRFNPVKAYSTALERSQSHLAKGFTDSSYFDSLCLIVNKKQYSELRALLEETKRKVSEIVSSREGPPSHLAYLNSNLFLASE